MNRISRTQLAQVLLEAEPKQRAKLTRLAAAHLVATGRAKQVDLLVRDIANMARKRYGHSAVSVTTAGKLTSGLKTQVENIVTRLEDTQTIEIDHKIDSSLLGGAVIRTPEREIDVSVRGRLKRLESLAK